MVNLKKDTAYSGGPLKSRTRFGARNFMDMSSLALTKVLMVLVVLVLQLPLMQFFIVSASNLAGVINLS